LGTAEIDSVANQGIDDFHERGLDAFLVFDEGDGVKARLGGSTHAADHALMEVAENFAAEGGRSARDSLTLMWVQRRMLLLSDMEFEPFESRLEKISDRVCKLLIWFGLESMI
jgi:hypothetical protein